METKPTYYVGDRGPTHINATSALLIAGYTYPDAFEAA